MKKIIFFFISVFLISGCAKTIIVPEKQSNPSKADQPEKSAIINTATIPQHQKIINPKPVVNLIKGLPERIYCVSSSGIGPECGKRTSEKDCLVPIGKKVCLWRPNGVPTIYEPIFSNPHRHESFMILLAAYNEMKKSYLSECGYYDYSTCLQSFINDEAKLEIALDYGIIDKNQNIDTDKVYIGFKKTYRWYWEIGACSTNRQIRIDAETGQETPLRMFTYCGGVL